MSQDNQHSLIGDLISQEIEHECARKTSLSSKISPMKSISIFFLSLFSLIALIESEWMVAGLLGFTSLFIIGIWHLTIKGTIKVSLMLTMASVITFIDCTYLLQSGGIHGTGIIWAVIVPAFFAILKGSNSLFWNAIFLGVNASIFVLMYVFHQSLPYNMDHFIHLTSAYVFISAIMYLMEFNRLRHQLNNDFSQFDLQTLVNNGSDILCIVDPLSRMLYISPAHTVITGFEDEEIIGKIGLDFVHPDDRMIAMKVLTKVVTSKETQQLRYRYRHKNGGWFWFEAKGTTIRNEQGEWLVILNVRDVNQQVELEEALQQSRKMEAVGTLAGGIAHNINNMLAAISNHLFLAKRAASTDSALQDRLGRIEDLTMQTSGIISQLLSFARKQHTDKQRIDFSALLNNTMKLIRESIPSNITIESQITTDPVYINGDSSQLQQAIINLILNARDACSQVASPHIQCELNTDKLDSSIASKHGKKSDVIYAHLQISDNGYGIKKEDQEHIFEPFFTTKNIGQGFGLGLSMVHGTVISHEGIIRAESPNKQGASFDIYLPLFQDKSIEEVKTTMPIAAEQMVHDGQETILIVDDSSAMLESSQAMLSEIGFNTIQASSGVEATALFQKNPNCCDLVLMDIVMPHMNGVEAARIITETNPNIPIIFFSAYSDDDPEQPNILPEGSTLIRKPVAALDLIQTIKETLKIS